jgi:hypothetical protein
MVTVWAIFTLVLLVAEPLHHWFHARATRDPDGTFHLVLQLHGVLLTLRLVTVAAGVLGAHGALC